MTRKGLTLIEILVAMFIFSIVLGALFTVLAAGRVSWNAGASQVDVQQEARKALDMMVKELRQTASAKISNVPADGTAYNTITFQTPIITITRDPITGKVVGININWSGNIQYSLGGLNGRQLLRAQGGIQRILANNILSIGFTRNAGTPTVLNITATAQKNTFSGFTTIQSSVTLNSKAKLRN